MDSGQEKILFAKSDKKNGIGTPETESETALTESDPNSNLSVSKSNEKEPNANSKIDALLNRAASKLDTALVAEKSPEDKKDPKP